MESDLKRELDAGMMRQRLFSLRAWFEKVERGELSLREVRAAAGMQIINIDETLK